MIDEAMQLVSALHAWHKVIRKRVVLSGHTDSESLDTVDELRRAADMIKKLSGENDELQSRLKHLEGVERDKDALFFEMQRWKRRAEAAERDIETLLMEGCAGCDFCAYFGTCSRSDIQETYCAPKWRGPCAENGGEA